MATNHAAVHSGGFSRGRVLRCILVLVVMTTTAIRVAYEISTNLFNCMLCVGICGVVVLVVVVRFVGW